MKNNKIKVWVISNRLTKLEKSSLDKLFDSFIRLELHYFFREEEIAFICNSESLLANQLQKYLEDNPRFERCEVIKVREKVGSLNSKRERDYEIAQLLDRDFDIIHDHIIIVDDIRIKDKGIVDTIRIAKGVRNAAAHYYVVE